jgi:hypothetical protein
METPEVKFITIFKVIKRCKEQKPKIEALLFAESNGVPYSIYEEP